MHHSVLLSSHCVTSWEGWLVPWVLTSSGHVWQHQVLGQCMAANALAVHGIKLRAPPPALRGHDNRQASHATRGCMRQVAEAAARRSDIIECLLVTPLSLILVELHQYQAVLMTDIDRR